MTTILFHENQLSERGTSIALYDYAYYAREYLNINPIIAFDITKQNNQSVIDKFSKEFEVYAYSSFLEVQDLIYKNNIDYFYAIKYGTKDHVIVDGAKNLIHSVFCSDTTQMHGHVYAVVSEWLSYKSNGCLPYVPHMINLPNHDRNFRKELQIPDYATVIGRHGGFDTFNIEFVPTSIVSALESRNDLWFVFLNTPQLVIHPRCIYLSSIVKLDEKVKFINTCDAMLHARDYGETFGLSILEFACNNKQIITYDNEELQTYHPLGGRNHFLYLKDNCFRYHDQQSLIDILINIVRKTPFDTFYLNEQFSPRSVISKFKEVFLS